MPLLQRELLQCAQMAKQTPHQYLHSQNVQLLEEREPPVSEQGTMNGEEVNENGKRKLSDSARYGEKTLLHLKGELNPKIKFVLFERTFKITE